MSKIRLHILPVLALALATTVGLAGFANAGHWNQLNQAGNEEYAQAHFPQAYDLWTKALAEADQLGAKDPRQAIALTNLGRVCRRLDKNAEAEALYQRALTIWPAADPNIADLVLDYFQLLRQQGKTAQAADLESKVGKKIPLSATGQPALVGNNTSPEFTSEYDRWQSLYKEEKYSEAAALARAKIKDMDETGKDNGHLPAALNFLISTCFAQNKFAEAEPIFWRYLQIVRQTKGATSVDYAQGMRNYASLLRKNGNNLEASSCDKEADLVLGKAPTASTQPAKVIYSPGIVQQDVPPPVVENKEPPLLEGADNSEAMQRSRNILRPRSGGY